MRISKKSQYGLRAMVELASYHKEGPLSVKAISKSQGIPLQYLEQIFNRLKKKRLVKTTRGPKGGYMLSYEPSKIKVAYIIKALEDSYSLTDCLAGKSKGLCSRMGTCTTKRFWERLNKSIKEILDSTTLKDICLKNPVNTREAGIEHNYPFQI